jgi:dihydrofolate reductase
MKLTLHTFLTVDGVMQAPGAFDEDRTDGFSRGGWLVPFADQDMGTIVNGWFDKADAILLGRNTYEVMCPYWSQVTDPGNIAGSSSTGSRNTSCRAHCATRSGRHHRVVRRRHCGGLCE